MGVQVIKANRETAGSCNACDSAVLREYTQVFEIHLKQSKFRLCQQCAKELVEQLPSIRQ